MADQPAKRDPRFMTTKDAKTQRRTERAHRKAGRDWFKTKRFVLPATLILLMGTVLAATMARNTWTLTAKTSPHPAATSAPSVKAVPARIGTKSRDGKLQFAVTGVERPGTTLPGKMNTTLTAQGEFVVVRVNVTNFGTTSQPPGCLCQVLVDDKGQEFKPSQATMSTTEALKLVRRLDPGSTVEGVLVLFDVAHGTKVANIELHASPSTPGVNVLLS
jgi:hypothetical protein